MPTVSWNARDASGELIDVQGDTDALVSPPGPAQLTQDGGEQTIRLLGPYTVNFNTGSIEGVTGVAFGSALPLGTILFRAWAVTYTLWNAGTSSFLAVGLGDGTNNVFLTAFDLQSDEWTAADPVISNIPPDTGPVDTVIAQVTAVATLRAKVLRTGSAPSAGNAKFWALVAVPS